MNKMIDRRGALLLLTAATVHAQAPDHVSWVANVLMRMETVKPGMTREKLLTVFTTEGGLSTRHQRTYVSQECPYVKVDVAFDAAGDAAAIEDPLDVIRKISRPYLQFSILD
jgi:hypothetical protein